MSKQRLTLRAKRALRKQSQRRVQAGLESLEDRRLLAAFPIHQYSMDDEGSTTLVDSIGSADGVIVGPGGQTGGQLVLSGGSSNTAPYGDLPNGLISGLTDVTIEAWYTLNGTNNWQRVFDFGSSDGGAGRDLMQAGRSADVLISGEAEHESDWAIQETALLNWNISQIYSHIGNLNDDFEIDGVNGGGGPDQYLHAVEDILRDLRSNDSSTII